MRRKDREITDICAILELVSECKVCRLAMTDGGRPLHSAAELRL